MCAPVPSAMPKNLWKKFEMKLTALPHRLATAGLLSLIALTALAAVLAMIPLSRSAFWGPMAVAIMGGLIVATALTLLFLPALYAAWFRVRRVAPATDVPSA